MDTNDILHQVLHACADATDDIAPGSGESMRKFADEKYGKDAGPIEMRLAHEEGNDEEKANNFQRRTLS